MMESEWDMRTFSFEPSGGSRKGGLGTLRDGEGNFVYARFLSSGAAVLRGFHKDSPMNPYREKKPVPWPGLVEGMPRSLRIHRDASGVEPSEVTFVIWHEARPAAHWQSGQVVFPRGKDPDGSEELLALCAGDPRAYVKHAAAVWGRPVPLEAVRVVYEHGAIDDALVRRMNPNADVEVVSAGARSLGITMAAAAVRPAKNVSEPQSTRRSTATTKPSARLPKKVNMGHAIFTVEARGDIITMTIAKGTVAEAKVSDRAFYSNLFADVKAKIETADRR